MNVQLVLVIPWEIGTQESNFVISEISVNQVKKVSAYVLGVLTGISWTPVCEPAMQASNEKWTLPNFTIIYVIEAVV